MTAWTTAPDGGAPGPEPSARRSRGAIAVLASVAQLGVLAFTFLMGLGWGAHAGTWSTSLGPRTSAESPSCSEATTTHPRATK